MFDSLHLLAAIETERFRCRNGGIVRRRDLETEKKASLVGKRLAINNDFFSFGKKCAKCASGNETKKYFLPKGG